MSIIGVGKDAKHNGATHPKNVPVPPDQATPKKGKKHKREKLYGYRYESAFFYPFGKPPKWNARRRWFASEVSRDQAFAKEFAHQQVHTSGIFQYRNLHKTER